MKNLYNLFYYGKNKFYQYYYWILNRWKKPSIAGKTVLKETTEYEKQILSRFLTTCFIQPDKIHDFSPTMYLLQEFSKGIIPWTKLCISWYLNRIRRDVVGRRPEGETIPSGRSPDADNEVAKVGHGRSCEANKGTSFTPFV